MRAVFRLFLGYLRLQWFKKRPTRIKIAEKERRFRSVWVDVSGSWQSTRITGVERVTHEISSALQQTQDGVRVNVRFFRVNHCGQAVELVPNWWMYSGRKRTIDPLSLVEFAPQDSVLFLDLSLPPNGFNKREVDFLQQHGISVSVMVFDVLPITHKELFPWGRYLVFQEWLRMVRIARGRIFISEASKRGFEEIAGSESPRTEAASELVVRLGGFSDWRPRHEKTPRRRGDWQEIVTVGTLEPRKDHAGILDAMELLWEDKGKFRLTIVGRKGWKCRKLVKRLQCHPRLGHELIWLDDCSDQELRQVMEKGEVLVANSIDEGFGLPLIEAAEAGLSVVARDIEVFREVLPNASFFEGGNPKKMKDKIIQVFSQPPSAPPVYNPQDQGNTWIVTAGQILSFVTR